MWLGIAALVAVPVVSVILYPDDARRVLVAFMVTLTLLFVLFEGFWWWRLVLAPVPLPAPSEAGTVPPVSALASWGDLADALAAHGGDPAARAAATARGRRAVAQFLFWQALCVVGVIAGGWMMALGLDEIAGIGIHVFMPIAVLAPLVILGVRMVGPRSIVAAGMEAADAATLAPLGLTVVEVPSVGARPMGSGSYRGAVGGATVVGGIRHGRRIEIVVGRGESSTSVEAPTTPFTVRSDNGKLLPEDGTPAAIAATVKELRRAKRWRGVSVEGGPDGIVVRRQARMASNPWLYDLWLCERLAAAVAASR